MTWPHLWKKRLPASVTDLLNITRFLPSPASTDLDHCPVINNELRTINRPQFLKMAYGDVESLKELATDFFTDTREHLPEWQSLLDAQDFTQLRHELHRCRGGASLFALDRLAAMVASRELPGALEEHGLDLALLARELEAAEKAVSEMSDAPE